MKETYLGFRNGVSKTTGKAYVVVYMAYPIDSKNGYGVGTYNKMYSGDKAELEKIQPNTLCSCSFDRFGNILSIVPDEGVGK